MIGYPLGLYYDDKGMCVSVLPHPGPDILKMPDHQKPHITIACAPGVKPYSSNELLSRPSIGLAVKDDYKLRGSLCTIGYDGTICCLANI